MVLSEIKDYIISYLEGIYNFNEAESIVYIILEDELKLSKIDLMINANSLVNEKSIDKIQEILIRLEKNEPIQYILGYADFYELKFKVNNYTLIPRQETELLVDYIIKQNKETNNLNILDIGTGSGCIAISLAKNLNSNITAVDFSEKALNIAKQNAELNNVTVNFKVLDIIKNANKIFENKFDIIVSNPPYVTNNEKTQMLYNVLEYEPHNALFVNDNNPLEFYKAITEFAKNNLNQNGQIWFEINEQYGNDTKLLLENNEFIEVEIIKDLNNKDRFVKALLV